LPIHSVAPIRICDNGGWTDTWFARHGQIFNIAVHPCAEVQLDVRPLDGPRITIHAENYGERYSLDPPNGQYSKHPLLEAAFDALAIPDDIAIEVSIYCDAPAGCSTGTSAAVSVALIGALDCLTPGRLQPQEVALTAQQIETRLLGQQCGIQDQLASAFGGINFIDMYEYPNATVHPIALPEETRWELEARLSLIFVGDSHNSSAVHEKVIAGLSPEDLRLAPLRRTAAASRNALLAADWEAFGAAMKANTEAQRGLHADLVGPAHQRIIEIAQEHGALGWKVNGAGGSGGSVTLLHGANRSAQRSLLRTITEENRRFQPIPIRLSPAGLRRWETATPDPRSAPKRTPN
jgi:D-glycero-alpha-D-manno-heptose-7-phosphate kinase